MKDAVNKLLESCSNMEQFQTNSWNDMTYVAKDHSGFCVENILRLEAEACLEAVVTVQVPVMIWDENGGEREACVWFESIWEWELLVWNKDS